MSASGIDDIVAVPVRLMLKEILDLYPRANAPNMPADRSFCSDARFIARAASTTSR